MKGFVGRSEELRILRAHVRSVQEGGQGIMLTVRGRRQVGKSRLVEQLTDTAGLPCVFFTAAQGARPDSEVRKFADEVRHSTLEAAPMFVSPSAETWEPSLLTLAAGLTKPSIVVVDELPYLLKGDPSLEGVLQRVWDRHLSRLPILLIFVGSDLSIMESLGAYDHPLYLRSREMVIEPLSVAETGAMLGLDAAAAFESQLVHGGFPALASIWQPGALPLDFVRVQLMDPTSPFVVIGERILNAELPPVIQARAVLEAIGHGERTFHAIGGEAGLSQASLARSLHVLVHDKRVVSAERPLSGRPSRLAHYRVADPYLRFWLRFIGPEIGTIFRGRGELLADRISQSWTSYRGRAMEPLVRASLERLMPDERLADAMHVGAYWTRNGDVEVDLVGGTLPQSPSGVKFVGSVKWRENAPFTREDLNHLALTRNRVPGGDHARVIGVSRSGFKTSDLDAAFGPDDLLQAWRDSG